MNRFDCYTLLLAVTIILFMFGWLATAKNMLFSVALLGASGVGAVLLMWKADKMVFGET